MVGCFPFLSPKFDLLISGVDTILPCKSCHITIVYLGHFLVIVVTMSEKIQFCDGPTMEVEEDHGHIIFHERDVFLSYYFWFGTILIMVLTRTLLPSRRMACIGLGNCAMGKLTPLGEFLTSRGARLWTMGKVLSVPFRLICQERNSGFPHL